MICFSSISMDSDYHYAVFFYVYGQRIKRSSLLCFSPDLSCLPCHVLFCGGDTTLPQVVFNSLMLYNNVSILYILSGEFQLKFQI